MVDGNAGLINFNFRGDRAVEILRSFVQDDFIKRLLIVKNALM